MTKPQVKMVRELAKGMGAIGGGGLAAPLWVTPHVRRFLCQLINRGEDYPLTQKQRRWLLQIYLQMKFDHARTPENYVGVAS